jgi:hypothetical protein
MVTDAEALRAEALGFGARGRGQRYPVEFRRRVVAVAVALRGRGLSWARIASEVGVRTETLRRWCEVGAASSGRALVPVQVLGSAGLAVVSPAGWRVEGLSLSDASALLRALS